MKLFKVTFVMNEVEACREVTSEFVFRGLYHYEYIEGRLIYAIIRAENKDAACDIARSIIKEMADKPARQMKA